VDDVSLSVAAGETVGLVGESGCGKSTLARVLARLIDPTEGSIRLRGEEIAGIPAARFGRDAARRAAIQMVFQDAEGSINPRHTAAEAIARPLRRLKGLSGAALAARVEEAASLCGLPPELLGRFPHQLSGGQKARVGIARAIATEPALLVLDEPTSALDVSVQVVILDLLKSLQARMGAAYLFVSHDLNLVRLLCDRVLVMYLGRVMEEGPAEQVFAAPAHPYTRALVGAVSVPGRRRGAGERPPRLAGEPRSPIDPDPHACRFHGRCPIGQDLCARQAAPVHRLPGGRTVACHFPDLPVPPAMAPAMEKVPAA
jgi:oligopeptide/dipeptide ABC transporter ATP-binding protein